MKEHDIPLTRANYLKFPTVPNCDAVFFYSLTVDDLLFLRSVGIKLSEREELRLVGFLRETTT